MAQRRVPLGSAITAPLTSVARPTATGIAAAPAQSPDPGSSFTITVVSLVFDRTSTAAYTAWPVSDGMRSRASFATTAALSGTAESAVHPHHFSPSSPSVGSSLGMGEPSTGLHWLGSAAAKFRWTTPALEKVWKPMPAAALLLAAATVRGRIRTSASCRIPFAPTLDANCTSVAFQKLGSEPTTDMTPSPPPTRTFEVSVAPIAALSITPAACPGRASHVGEGRKVLAVIATPAQGCRALSVSVGSPPVSGSTARAPVSTTSAQTSTPGAQPWPCSCMGLTLLDSK